MKRIFLIGILLLVFYQTTLFCQFLSNQTSLHCQHCLPEGITFSSQAQIDSFQFNYPGCKKIIGDVKIDGDDITNLNGLIGLTSTGGLRIIDNCSLMNLSGLDNLDSVGGNVIIGGNNNLNSISALDRLTFIPGDLEIGSFYSQNYHGNPLLTSLAGLNNIDSVGGSLNIFRCASLFDLTGLERLKQIGSGLGIGGMWSGGNSLQYLSGLDSLVSVGGGLDIVFNSGLQNLHGLEKLVQIGGDLSIYGNDSMTSLSGLVNLTSIGGGINLGNFLYYPGNLLLRDISELENVTINGDINIAGNHALSECAIESICNYLANPIGTTLIYYNAPGCNTPEEVKQACDSLPVPEISKPCRFIIHPNPFYETTMICFELDTPAAIEVIIYDKLGKVVREFPRKEYQPGDNSVTWQAEGLPAGIYLIGLQDGTTSVDRKIIKL